jgi:hypothetical protein
VGVRELLPLVPQLSELSLTGDNLTDAGALTLADAIDPTKLVRLCLAYSPLSRETVTALRNCSGYRFSFTTREEDNLRARGAL